MGHSKATSCGGVNSSKEFVDLRHPKFQLSQEAFILLILRKLLVFETHLHKPQLSVATLRTLDLEKVKALCARCEVLIEASQADVEDYELYLNCQNEIVRRTSQRSPHVFLSKFFPHFISTDA